MTMLSIKMEAYTMSLLSWLIVIAVINEVRAQDPKVSITNTHPVTMQETKQGVKIDLMNAIRDSDVTISCYVEDLNPNMQVRWRKSYKNADGQYKQMFISTDMAITDNTKYSIEKPTDYTWRLRIKDIQVWDEAIYECYVQLTELSVSGQIRHVDVLVPPYLTPSMVSPDSSITEGEDINLLCDAQGRPPPMIEWTRLGGALLSIGKEKHMGGMLSIENVKPRDRGPYRCKVWNSIGQIKRDILLDVRFKPQIMPGTPEVIEQAIGYSTTLQCRIEANPVPRESEMKWVKDGLSYTQSTGKYIVRTIIGAFNRLTYEIIIDGVSNEDYGTYTCHISNAMSLQGPIRHNVLLTRSTEPVESPKINRVVKGGEWQRRFNGLSMRETGAASNLVMSASTIFLCLFTAALNL